MELDLKILSSAHVNFLFGAGVNGSAFPQLAGFSETQKRILRITKKPFKNFEETLNLLPEHQRASVLKVFKNEFCKYMKSLTFEESSIMNISRMFLEFNRIFEESENRTETTKQVNVYTFNYDDIVDKVLLRNGFLSNVISASNIDNHDKFFNIVGHDYVLGKFVPTYLVSKIHGDIDKPILPGKNKYGDILESKFFEIIFKMKAQLMKFNSILFVIGYSGNDLHINRILKDCVLSGLTVYWFKYKTEDSVPFEISDKVFVVEQNNPDNPEDCTQILERMVKRVWAKSLEE